MTKGKPGSASTSGWLIALLLSALLAGCGGGGGSDAGDSGSAAATTTVGGQGNFGAPINGGTVAMVCAGSTIGTTVTTNATGQFTVTAPGGAPCVIRIAGGNLAGGPFYSILAAGQTRANVNQLTTMLAFRLADGNPESFFTSPGSISTKITAAAVAKDKATIMANVIANLGGAAGIATPFDFLETPFASDSTGFDLILDKLGFTSAGNTDASITFDGAPLLTANPTTDVDSITTSTQIDASVLAAAGPSGATAPLASVKAITAYSLSGAAGTIDEAAKTIAVALPSGTNVAALVATFTTTGAGAKVGSSAQTSGSTANNFTNPVAYTITAADATTVAYTVTVTVAPANATVLTGQAPVNLGTAGNFTILTKTGISTTGTTLVTGDIGVSPNAATSITGFGLVADPSNVFSTSTLVTTRVYAANYAAPTPATMTTAVANMETAFTDAAGRPAGVGPNLNLLAGNLTPSQTLAPGVYTWNTPGNVSISTNLTLTGGANDVWIFQITGTLRLETGVRILLAGGAQAKNIFWQVSGAVTLLPSSHFEGVILGQTNIAVQTGATANARLLAQTAVTLQANPVTPPAP